MTDCEAGGRTGWGRSKSKWWLASREVGWGRAELLGVHRSHALHRSRATVGVGSPRRKNLEWVHMLRTVGREFFFLPCACKAGTCRRILIGQEIEACTQYFSKWFRFCGSTSVSKFDRNKKNQILVIPLNFVKFDKIRPNFDWMRFCTVKNQKTKNHPNLPINRTELAKI
jgi:hypothetical protein